MAAFSSMSLDKNDFLKITEAFLKYAPQLGCKVNSTGSHHDDVEFSRGDILSFGETSDFEKGLFKFIDQHDVVYDAPDLPNFRTVGLKGRQTRPNNTNAAFFCMSSHALMEGSESARLLLAKPKSHPVGLSKPKIGLLKRSMITAAGALLAPMHLLASRFNKKATAGGRWLIIDIDRKAIKKIATENKVSQRSVLFSLPLHWLQSIQDGTQSKKKRSHTVSYSTLPKEKTILEDSALNLRMQVAQFRKNGNYLQHLQLIQSEISKENNTEIYSQAFYNSILGVHRAIHRLFPRFYGERFFTYVPYDFVLSLLPPHTASGIFRDYFDGPIFCGSYTPGVNSCVFVPHRNGLSLNMFLDPETHAEADGLLILLNQLNIRHRRLS